MFGVETLGQRIRRLRHRANLTHLALAMRIGLRDRREICMWEADRRAPTIHNFARLARELRVSMDDLYGPVAPE